MTRKLCRTAVSAANFEFDRLYSYLIPQELEQDLEAGMRVIVPFGKGNRKVEGFAVRIQQTDDDGDYKEIISVLDKQPVADENMIRLAAYMCTSLYCTFFDCLKAMLPSGLWFHHRQWYSITEDGKEKLTLLTAEYPFLELFAAGKKKIELKDIEKFCPDKKTAKQLDKLCEQGILTFSSSFSRKIGDKTQKMYALNMPPEQAMRYAEKGSPVRTDIVGVLSQHDELDSHELIYQTGASAGIIRTMVKQGILRAWEQECMRLPDFSQCEKIPLSALTDSQQDAYDKMADMLDEMQAKAALLFGVTGSGKTEVYLHLIQKALSDGKGAIVLVPEIGLTPQMLRRFVCSFGDVVVPFHSALSVGERYDSWKRIKSGAAKVIVGTRSAVFAPVKNLGLIIIDEEQDDAYKSGQTPRYHARDIAKYRAVQENALLILGSATPSVETFYGAEKGKYPMFSLNTRYGGTALPEVTIADMRQSAQQNNFGSIGNVLREHIAQTLENGGQAILFLNRRGAARQVVCPICSWRPECPNCSVTMTYHSANGRLMCHYCGHSQTIPAVCPQCGAQHLKTDIAGTQRVERELHDLFPNVRVLRMDTDTTGTKNSHEMLLNRFENREADILLGTQMVTKGLDFDNVSLVGVIDADQSLFAQDYRAKERTFSLLTQVAGRAGRRGTRGRAVIQTHVPDNEVIIDAACQNYMRFYQNEIELRYALLYPPVSGIVTLNASAQNENDVLEALVYVKKRIEGLMNGQFSDFRFPVLGPAPSGVLKVMGRYRYHLTIRCPDGKRRRELIGGILREFASDKRFKKVKLYADINAEEI